MPPIKTKSSIMRCSRIRSSSIRSSIRCKVQVIDTESELGGNVNDRAKLRLLCDLDIGWYVGQGSSDWTVAQYVGELVVMRRGYYECGSAIASPKKRRAFAVVIAAT